MHVHFFFSSMFFQSHFYYGLQSVICSFSLFIQTQVQFPPPSSLISSFTIHNLSFFSLYNIHKTQCTKLIPGEKNPTRLRMCHDIFYCVPYAQPRLMQECTRVCECAREWTRMHLFRVTKIYLCVWLLCPCSHQNNSYSHDNDFQLNASRPLD